MDANRRSGARGFRPGGAGALEPRRAPSSFLHSASRGGAARTADVGTLNATLTGGVRPIVNGDVMQHGVDFSGSGKDQAGRAVSIRGSLVTYEPGPSVNVSGTSGAALLTTRRGTFGLTFSGPASDLTGSSGLSNLRFSASRSKDAAGVKFAEGSLQIHREPGPSGPEFTATIVASPLRAAKGR